jgi:hypothetical protein
MAHRKLQACGNKRKAYVHTMKDAKEKHRVSPFCRMKRSYPFYLLAPALSYKLFTNERLVKGDYFAKNYIPS